MRKPFLYCGCLGICRRHHHRRGDNHCVRCCRCCIAQNIEIIRLFAIIEKYSQAKKHSPKYIIKLELGGFICLIVVQKRSSAPLKPPANSYISQEINI